MARRPRIAPGGYIYHVFNRSVGRMKLFSREKDFQAFETLIAEAQERHPMRILSYCLMGTHWHFVVRPKRDGELTAFFRWLSHTHAMRWRVAHRTVGYGHLYQGRFKNKLAASPFLGPQTRRMSSQSKALFISNRRRNNLRGEISNSTDKKSMARTFFVSSGSLISSVTALFNLV